MMVVPFQGPDVIVVEDNCPLFGIFLKSSLWPEYFSYKSNISLLLTLEYIGIPFLLADEFGLIVFLNVVRRCLWLRLYQFQLWFVPLFCLSAGFVRLRLWFECFGCWCRFSWCCFDCRCRCHNPLMNLRCFYPLRLSGVCLEVYFVRPAPAFCRLRHAGT